MTIIDSSREMSTHCLIGAIGQRFLSILPVFNDCKGSKGSSSERRLLAVSEQSRTSTTVPFTLCYPSAVKQTYFSLRRHNTSFSQGMPFKSSLVHRCPLEQRYSIKYSNKNNSTEFILRNQLDTRAIQITPAHGRLFLCLKPSKYGGSAPMGAQATPFQT